MKRSKGLRLAAYVMAVVMLTTVFSAFSSAMGGWNTVPVKAAAEDFEEKKYTYDAEMFSGNSYFITRDHVLVAYLGYGGDVVIPDGITDIADGCFKYRKWYQDREWNTSKYYYYRKYYSEFDGVGKISFSSENNRFYNYNYGERSNKLTSITFPSSLKTIGRDAFWGQTEIKSITLPDSVTEIGDYAFCNCTKLKDIKLNSGLTTIGEYAFAKSSAIKKLVIPNTVDEIGKGAFYECSGLTDLTLSEKLTDINDDTFYGCTSLLYLALPEKIRNIGKGAFGKCAIQQIYLPASLLGIAELSFGNYANSVGWGYLTDVYYAGSSSDRISNGGSNSRIFNALGTKWHMNSTVADYMKRMESAGGGSAASGSAISTHGGLFYDNLHSYPVADDEIIIYANGSKIKTVTGVVNVNQQVLYTDIKQSYLHKNGKASTGKVVAVVTTSSTKPSVYNGKVADTSAKNIATAKITNGVITLKAGKEPGEVYLHVIDTGDDNVYASVKFTVKVAPTYIELKKKIEDTDTYVVFKNGTINVGESLTLYMNAQYKNGSGGMTELEEPDVTSSVAAKISSCFDVEETEPGVYKITAKALINGKKTSGAITFSSIYGNKKTKIKLSAINEVKEINLTGVNGDSNFEMTGEDSFTLWLGKNSVGPLGENKTVQIVTDVVTASALFPATESGRIKQMGLATGFEETTFTEKGKLNITVKPEGGQKKITARASKDNKSITVRLKKGATVGTTAYFIYYFNNQSGGYKVFSVSIKRRS